MCVCVFVCMCFWITSIMIDYINNNDELSYSLKKLIKFSNLFQRTIFLLNLIYMKLLKINFKNR
jgi:hypothetical protein